MSKRVSRREFLKAGLFSAAGLTGLAAAARTAGAGGVAGLPASFEPPAPPADDHAGHDVAGTVGDVDTSRFDPLQFLTHFDYGRTSRLPSGQTLREWDITAVDAEIEVAPGVYFPAWTYNGQVPGPTLRAAEGDRLRVNFYNGGSHPHSIHFHGIHPPSMDGMQMVQPGEWFVYEFDAAPFGLHLYHCHVMPLRRHIHKGLYGVFIIDPRGGRPPAREMVMVMNGFDTNFDNENEIYAVNTVAFHYMRHPVPVKVGELIRLYLVNLTEFDPINSFHLHAEMFKLFRTGTRPDQWEYTDTVMMCQGERHILEFTLGHPGRYMFHAHQSELAELGWLGFFNAI